MSGLQVPPISLIPVGESLQDHPTVNIRVLLKAPTIKPHAIADQVKNNQYLFQRTGNVNKNIATFTWQRNF